MNHLLLILLVVAIWGFNFVFIRIGLNGFPPVLLSALRFGLSSIPAVFFIRRPPCSWKLLIAYGLVLFGLQFGFLFTAMAVGMSAGLASLIMQFQVFFTMVLAAIFFKERPSPWKIVGAFISFAGITYVAVNMQGDVTAAGLILTLLASLSWGAGNILSKKIGKVSPLALVVWGSLIATPLLIICSIGIEGPEKIITSMKAISLPSILSIFYIVYVSTHIAYSLWSYLLNYYPTSVVAPFTLLVPVFGFLGSVLFLDELLPPWKIVAAALVISGLCFNLLESRIKAIWPF